MNEHNIHLTSSEIGSLWTIYMNETMSECMLRFMLQHIQDEDIEPIVRYAYDISSNHVKQLTAIFESEHFAIPKGFGDEDVNMEAPWLFTDSFCLTYVNQMSKVGMVTYSSFVSMSYKRSIRDFVSNALNDVLSLFNESMDVSLAKGLNARHPYIEVPHHSSFIHHNNYFSGLNPFSDKRPLNAIEISHLYLNVMTNSLGENLCLAFAQTSPMQEVQDFMLKAKKMSQKHIKIFSETLQDNDIQTPQVPDVSISNSTTPTFSDKLMMFHLTLIISTGTGNYVMAGAVSQRIDLVLNYERLSFEVGQLAKRAANLMVKYHWLEQSPGTPNREQLAKGKDKS
ncbi:hypothetical protein J416_09634 [Gracilibacillus halophilus YIM-C55.5]|uniref:DUF3231 family protein n=1 Tax=Gracilibacillus halophilus YIM-C55.5 TaxID=1308866 RepID=N4W8M4_9BACI|nr:DUF3231 family protein [Gracilibacillus halophilus]ENH96628.1 hypothetical protein J416_09634 [Gracilibacillus halophilus YIM-C55.5]